MSSPQLNRAPQPPSSHTAIGHSAAKSCSPSRTRRPPADGGFCNLTPAGTMRTCRTGLCSMPGDPVRVRQHTRWHTRARMPHGALARPRFSRTTHSRGENRCDHNEDRERTKQRRLRLCSLHKSGGGVQHGPGFLKEARSHQSSFRLSSLDRSGPVPIRVLPLPPLWKE